MQQNNQVSWISSERETAIEDRYRRIKSCDQEHTHTPENHLKRMVSITLGTSVWVACVKNWSNDSQAYWNIRRKLPSSSQQESPT